MTNLIVKEVNEPRDVRTLMDTAHHNRKRATTKCNERSSRSHFVCNIKIQSHVSHWSHDDDVLSRDESMIVIIRINSDDGGTHNGNDGNNGDDFARQGDVAYSGDVFQSGDVVQLGDCGNAVYFVPFAFVNALTFMFVSCVQNSRTNETLIGSLDLVALAGSEQIKESGSTGEFKNALAGGHFNKGYD